MVGMKQLFGLLWTLQFFACHQAPLDGQIGNDSSIPQHDVSVGISGHSRLMRYHDDGHTFFVELLEHA